MQTSIGEVGSKRQNTDTSPLTAPRTHTQKEKKKRFTTSSRLRNVTPSSRTHSHGVEITGGSVNADNTRITPQSGMWATLRLGETTIILKFCLVMHWSFTCVVQSINSA